MQASRRRGEAGLSSALLLLRLACRWVAASAGRPPRFARSLARRAQGGRRVARRWRSYCGHPAEDRHHRVLFPDLTTAIRTHIKHYSYIDGLAGLTWPSKLVHAHGWCFASGDRQAGGAD
jgi:hypothetical protein